MNDEYKYIDFEGIKDEWYCVTCGQCKYFCNGADLESNPCYCKRIDHKKIKFAEPWFKSYDCGQFSRQVCCEFVPTKVNVWLYQHWTKIEDFIKVPEKDTLTNVWLILDNNKNIRYGVSAYDWFYGNVFDAEGNLNWREKEYYKQSRNAVSGYKLIKEKRDG